MKMQRQHIAAKPRQRGFVLMLAVTTLALLAVVMVVLTAGARTMQFHADRAYLRAVQDNLTQSGLAWAEHYVKGSEPHVPTGPVELDAGYRGQRKPRLIVDIEQYDRRVARVAIDISAQKAGQRTSSRQTHLIRTAASEMPR